MPQSPIISIVETDHNGQFVDPMDVMDEGFEEGFFEEDRGREGSTHSLRLDVYQAESVHGHTYHAFHAGKYMLPNDEDEQDRCDIMYQALGLALGNRLYFAPISSPQAVLDIGTGTGIWAMDLADLYPACEVLGTDLSPIQPLDVPPNLKWELADADDEWTFVPRFDLVHTRAMNDTSLHDWPHYYREAFKVLKPGGWVEAQELSYRRTSDNNSIPIDSRITEWEDLWTQGMNKVGFQVHCNPDLVEQQIAAAGFVNIMRHSFKLPIGGWPNDPMLKQAGIAGYHNFKHGVHGLSTKVFTQVHNWSIEKLEYFLSKCQKELRKKEIHAYWPVWVLCGQKPTQNRMPDEGQEAEHCEEV